VPLAIDGAPLVFTFSRSLLAPPFASSCVLGGRGGRGSAAAGPAPPHPPALSAAVAAFRVRAGLPEAAQAQLLHAAGMAMRNVTRDRLRASTAAAPLPPPGRPTGLQRPPPPPPPPAFALNPVMLATAILPAPSQRPAARRGRPLRLFTHDTARCKFLSQQLHRYGEWEPRLSREVLARFGNPPARSSCTTGGGEEGAEEPRVLLDVGGHVGWYSLLVGAAGHRAIALEPMRYNRELFEASVVLNGLGASPADDLPPPPPPPQSPRSSSSSSSSSSPSSAGLRLAPGVTVVAAAAGGAGSDGSGPALCMRPMGGHDYNSGNGQIFLRHDEEGARKADGDGDGGACMERVRTTSIDALLYGSGRSSSSSSSSGGGGGGGGGGSSGGGAGGGGGSAGAGAIAGLWGRGRLPPPIWGAKFDIEGFEVHALRGAWRLLSDVRRRPCVLWFEPDEVLAAQAGARKWEPFEQLMGAHGYRLFRRGSAGVAAAVAAAAAVDGGGSSGGGAGGGAVPIHAALADARSEVPFSQLRARMSLGTWRFSHDWELRAPLSDARCWQQPQQQQPQQQQQQQQPPPRVGGRRGGHRDSSGTESDDNLDNDDPLQCPVLIDGEAFPLPFSRRADDVAAARHFCEEHGLPTTDDSDSNGGVHGGSSSSEELQAVLAGMRDRRAEVFVDLAEP
jgi:hypothetical protein